VEGCAIDLADGSTDRVLGITNHLLKTGADAAGGAGGQGVGRSREGQGHVQGSEVMVGSLKRALQVSMIEVQAPWGDQVCWDAQERGRGQIAQQRKKAWVAHDRMHCVQVKGCARRQ
jgi:hypothetical protein